MTVLQVDANTEIQIGQWICPTPKVQNSLCRPPLKVVGIVGKRLHCRMPGWGASDPDKYMMRSSAKYLCDTEEEADRISALSNERIRAIEAAAQAVAEEFDSKLATLLHK